MFIPGKKSVCIEERDSHVIKESHFIHVACLFLEKRHVHRRSPIITDHSVLKEKHGIQNIHIMYTG